MTIDVAIRNACTLVGPNAVAEVYFDGEYRRIDSEAIRPSATTDDALFITFQGAVQPQVIRNDDVVWRVFPSANPGGRQGHVPLS